MKKYLLWLLLAIPGTAMSIRFLMGITTYQTVMNGTGEFSARLLIITLIATPLALLFPNAKIPRWLVRNRRYFGVAAFAYALVHTIFYLNELMVGQVMSDFFQIAILTGWITFFIFIPLALTSNDAAVKRLKGTWKKLQRWVYLAAVLTFVHWALVHFHWKAAMVHFVPVLGLQVWRIWKEQKRI